MLVLKLFKLKNFLFVRNKKKKFFFQVFDSWAGELSPSIFKEFSLPYLQQIAINIKKVHPSVPIVVFAKGANYALAELSEAGYDVVGLDWTVEPAEAVKMTGKFQKVALQGTLLSRF
jgi:uroporphyrinogen decarboxylase